MKNILITGGAGFIGSNYISLIDPNEYQIYVCDQFNNSFQWENLKKISIEEVIPPSKISSWLKSKKNLDYIIHMGAISSTTEKNVNLLLASNFEFSKILWNYATLNSIPFIYASSASVYGNGDKGYSDNDSLTSKLSPLNAYGWSKLLFDKWVLKECKLNNKPPIWAGLRFFNVYGPRESHKGDMKSMVTKSFEKLINSRKVIELFKSYKSDYNHGEQKRDFVYVKDCVDVIKWFHDGNSANGIYNVGSGKASSWNSLAKNVFECLGIKENIKYIEMPENIKDQYQYFTQADISKLKDNGWEKPFHNLQNGILDYSKIFLKNNIKN